MIQDCIVKIALPRFGPMPMPMLRSGPITVPRFAGFRVKTPAEIPAETAWIRPT